MWTTTDVDYYNNNDKNDDNDINYDSCLINITTDTSPLIVIWRTKHWRIDNKDTVIYVIHVLNNKTNITIPYAISLSNTSLTCKSWKLL